MIPFVDLKAQHRALKPELEAAFERVMKTTQFILGQEVEAFEDAFAAFVGVDHMIGVNSGTSALHLALLSSGVGPGDEVIAPAMTFIATTAAISYCGARPVLVDVDPVTCTIDASRIEPAITPRTKAIIPVHLYGQMADMEAISAIAEAHNLPVVEDAAQAHGATRNGQAAGSIGHFGCFSFYPGKNLGACGEGGAVATKDPEAAKQVRVLRDWGQERRYEHSVLGYNYRMDGLQGAFLRAKLNHLDAWTEARRNHAERYNELLKDSDLVLPVEGPGNKSAYHIYGIRHPERDRLRAALAERDIATGLHYPIPIHLQPAYSALGYREGEFPVSESIAREELSLPLFPELTMEQQEEVAGILLAQLADAPRQKAGVAAP